MAKTAARQGRSLRILRRLAITGLAFAGLCATVWWAALPASPDRFYDLQAGPNDPAGTLLGRQPFTHGIPADTAAWRIVYRTSDENGAARTASALVLYRSTIVAAGVRPVIAWAHGTTGIARGCAPSLLDKPLNLLPALEEALRQGWVIVASDYVGLGTPGPHAYLEGPVAGRAILDAARVTRALPDLNAGGPVTVWGHSQGGGAALWTGSIANSYAPELPLAGIAALAPASDLIALMRASTGGIFGKIVSAFVFESLASVNEDVARAGYVTGFARLISADIARRCVSGLGALVSVAQTFLFPDAGLFTRDPSEGPLGAMLRRNTPLQEQPVPVLIAQGEADDLVRPDIQTGYVTALCARSRPVEFRRYRGKGHVDLVEPGSALDPDLIAWTKARIAGEAARDDCPT